MYDRDYCVRTCMVGVALSLSSWIECPFLCCSLQLENSSLSCFFTFTRRELRTQLSGLTLSHRITRQKQPIEICTRVSTFILRAVILSNMPILVPTTIHHHTTYNYCIMLLYMRQKRRKKDFLFLVPKKLHCILYPTFSKLLHYEHTRLFIISTVIV